MTDKVDLEAISTTPDTESLQFKEDENVVEIRIRTSPQLLNQVLMDLFRILRTRK